MAYVFFTLSIILLLLAHTIRVYRWSLFINVYEKADMYSLFETLSVGYIVNHIVPFKLGDLLRAILSGRKMKNGTALGFSTVIIDRCLDVFAVGLIFVAFSVCKVGNQTVNVSARFYIFVAIGMTVLMLIIYTFKSYIKKMVLNLAGLFNTKVETWLLCFFWALIWNFKDIIKRINLWVLSFYTVIMWLVYLSSYGMFALSLQMMGKQVKFLDIFMSLFTQKSIENSTGLVSVYADGLSNVSPFIVTVYLIAPLFLMLCISPFFRKKSKKEYVSSIEKFNLFPHINSRDRLLFLENYFSNSNKEFIEEYLRLNQNLLIIKDYSAGSSATTLLCLEGDKTFFRKYAFGESGEKLYKQIQWIEENKNTIALPPILQKGKTKNVCFYDMPHDSACVGLFEYAHTMPIDSTWILLEKILNQIKTNLHSKNQKCSNKEEIRTYWENKVQNNLECLMSTKYYKTIEKYDRIIINGKEYANLPQYLDMLSFDNMYSVFKSDECSSVHGDLTVENIICVRNKEIGDDFYLIDPNPENIHNSSNLDYGKLLQSLHGQYEILMSIKYVNCNENHIDFLGSPSLVYRNLYDRYREYLLKCCGNQQMKSAYYHEIVHWLRLIPYKFRKNSSTAPVFFAGLLMVLNDIVDLFGRECND